MIGKRNIPLAQALKNMAQIPRSQKITQNSNDRQYRAASAVSTKQIAKDAVRGGPKSVKKDKRPSGHGQKG